MASLPEPQFEEERDKFEAEQLKPVEALYAANAEQIDFEFAETIELISVDVRKRIEAELKDDSHISLFKRTLDANMREVDRRGDEDHMKAFKRAFETVCGRFLFEDDKALGIEDSKYLDKVLKDALKFPIDAKYGFRGRPELQAAVRRLAMIASQDKVKSLRADLDKRTGYQGRVTEGLARDIQALDALVIKFDELNSLQSRIASMDDALSHAGERFSVFNDLATMLDSFGQTVKEEAPVRSLSRAEIANRASVYKLYEKCQKTLAWIEKNENKPTAMLGELVLNMRQLGKIARSLLVARRSELNTLSKLKAGSNTADSSLNGAITSDSVKKFIDEILGGVKSDTEISKLEEEYTKAVQDKKDLDVLHKYFSDKASHTSIVTEVSKLEELIKKNKKVPASQDSIKAICKTIKERLSNFVKNFKVAARFKLEPSFVEMFKTGQMVFPFVTEDGTREARRPTLKEIEDRLDKIDFDTESFDPNDLIQLYSVFEPFLKGSSELNTFLGGFQSKFAETDNKINERKVTLNNAKRAKALNESPMDIPAAKIIIGSYIEEAEEELKTAIDEKRPANDIEKLRERVDQLKGYLSPVRWIIEKAFAGTDPLKIIELEREHTDAKAKEEALTEHYKYFSGKGPGEIHDKFGAIKDRTVTRKDVRELEAKFKKAEENKATLGNLKDLFSEAKTSALHDLFQEFSALRSGYELAQAETDLDSRITAESSSISVLESQLTAEFTAKKKQKSKNEPTKESGPDDRYLIGIQDKTEDLKKDLHQKKLAVERLKKLKADLDKFKDFAKKLRGELQKYCREYLVAFELGQNPTKPTKDEIENAKKKLDAINVEKGFEFSGLETIYETLKSGFVETFGKVKARLEETDLTLSEKQALEDKKSELDKAKALHTDLKAVVDRIKILKDLGVNIPGWDVAQIITEFEAIKIDDMNFRVEELITFYSKYFSSLFENPAGRKGLIEIFEKRFAGLKDEVKNKLRAVNIAKAEAKNNENLTDSQAAKRLITAIVAEQNPDMSLADQQKLASMILANDVATIQTEASYAELAQRGSAEKLDTVRQAGFKRKLIGFQYKEGDKTVAPFKGLKPEQFENWAEIERLFKIGRLNHQNGFFVLAAMKAFAPKDTEGLAIPQIQAVKLEKKLKAALAEELGVDERMDEAGIDKILNKAFADQMKKAQELVKAYFQHFDRNVDEWNGNKIKELNLRYARVKEERNLGKITEATFQKRMAELVDEAKETDLLDQVQFSQDSAMAEYWNSPFAQWFRDRGWDVGRYAKGKAKSLALSGVKLGAFGLWGATKLGLSATLQTALLPLRAVKYPLLLAAKPLVGVINLFRSQKWTPLPTIRDTVRSDAGRVAGYFKTKGSETWKGTAENVTGVPKAEWAKNPWATKEYKERTKADLAAMEEQAKELKAKGDATPVEVAGSPFIDLKKYRDEIAKLDRILAQKPAEERGGSAAGGASGEARAAA